MSRLAGSSRMSRSGGTPQKYSTISADGGPCAEPAVPLPAPAEVIAGFGDRNRRPRRLRRRTRSTSSMIGRSRVAAERLERRRGGRTSPGRRTAGRTARTRTRTPISISRAAGDAGIEREPETAGRHPRIAARAARWPASSRREPRVGVQKEEPVAAREGRARIHLPRAPARRVDPDDVRPRRAQRRQRGILGVATRSVRRRTDRWRSVRASAPRRGRQE